MVTKREQIDYYNLKISVEPVDEKPFYLTGDSPLFNVAIENQTSMRQQGKVVVRWRLAEVLTLRVVKFDLGPHASRKYELPREWLYRQGTAVYELIVMPQSPNHYASIPDQQVIQACHRMGIHTIHPLCSYYVRDKDLHKYEERHRKITIGLSVVVIILTVINLILFIIARRLISFAPI